MTRIVSDTDAIDAMATLLGTSAEWSSAADYLDSIATIIGTVRPHPGDSADTYRDRFRDATGRDVPTEWDFTDDDDVIGA